MRPEEYHCMSSHEDTDEREIVWLSEGISTIAEVVARISFPVAKILKLNLHGNRIQSVNGIELFVSLQELCLASNEITAVRCEGLQALEHLRVLNLASNNISTISFGGGSSFSSMLPNLERLDLSYNQLSDISALSQLSKLQYLDLRDNLLQDVGSLAPLTSCPSLVSLRLQDQTFAPHSNPGGLPTNPMCSENMYPTNVLELLPTLEIMDGITVDTVHKLTAGFRSNNRTTALGSSKAKVEEIITPMDVADTHTPHYDRVAKKFLSAQLAKLGGSSLKKNTNSYTRADLETAVGNDSDSTVDNKSDVSVETEPNDVLESCHERVVQVMDDGIENEYVSNVQSRAQNPWEKGNIPPKRWQRTSKNQRHPPQLSISGRQLPRDANVSKPHSKTRFDASHNNVSGADHATSNTQLLQQSLNQNLSKTSTTQIIDDEATSFPAVWEPIELCVCFKLLGGDSQTASVHGDVKCIVALRCFNRELDPNTVPKTVSWKTFCNLSAFKPDTPNHVDVSVQADASDMNHFQSEINSLNATLKDRDGQIDSLTDELSQRTKLVKSLQETLAEKTKQIESLQVSKEEQTSRVDDVNESQRIELERLSERLLSEEEAHSQSKLELSALRNEIQQLQSQNLQLQTKLQFIQTNNTQLETTNEKLQRKERALSKSLKKQKERSQTQQLELANRASELAHENYSLEIVNGQLEESIKDLKRDLSLIQDKVNQHLQVEIQFQTKLAEKENEIDRVRDTLKRNKEERHLKESEHQARVRALEVQLNEAVRDSEGLQRKYALEVKRTRKACSTNIELEKANKELVSVVKAQRARLEHLIEEKTKLSRKASTATVHKNAMMTAEQNLAAAKEEIQCKDKKLRETLENLEELQVKLLKIQSKHESEIETIKQANAGSLSELQGKLETAESVVKIKNAMLDDQNITLVELRQKLDVMQEQSAKDSRIARDAERRVAELLATRDELEAELESQEANVKDLESIMESMRENEVTSKEFRIKMTEKDEIISLIEEEMSTFRNEFKRRDQELKQLRFLLDEKQDECETLNDKVKQLEAKISELEMENKHLAVSVKQKDQNLEVELEKQSKLNIELEQQRQNFERLRNDYRSVTEKAAHQASDIKILARSLEVERAKREESVRRFEALYRDLRD